MRRSYAKFGLGLLWLLSSIVWWFPEIIPTSLSRDTLVILGAIYLVGFFLSSIKPEPVNYTMNVSAKNAEELKDSLRIMEMLGGKRNA